MNDAPSITATEPAPAPAPVNKQVVTTEKLTKTELGSLRHCLKLRAQLRDMVSQANALGARMGQKQIEVHQANDALADDIAKHLGFESFRMLLDQGFEIGVEPTSGAVTLSKIIQPEPVAP